jgi:hypothetical protein
VGAGDLLAYDHGKCIWGTGVSDFPGCLLSGLVGRDNVVAAGNALYSTNGLNGINANVIEQDHAYWKRTFPTLGFLVQDNSPPAP